MLMKKIIYSSVLVVFMLMSPLNVIAKVSPEEAEKLKTTLTPFGAERAGNEDGSIPSWDGGLTGPPEGVVHKPGERHINPFADEEKSFSITAENVDEYEGNIPRGQKELLLAYPETYRLDVYPTHRTHAAPDWVYENTFKNATRSITSDGGISVKKAYGGIPFPIPKTAEQVIWNHLMRWQGQAKRYSFSTLYVRGDDIILGSGVENWEKFPYYLEDQSLETFDSQDYWYVLLAYNAPPRMKGELILVQDPINRATNPRRSWQYLVGQRRVRRAPSINYDTPLSSLSGIHTWDDVYMFNGGIDRYNWKIVGKKEMYIPYNCYKVETAMETKEIFYPGHVNPDYLRWERHRIWQVEATLKEGSRHIYAKRVFYIDEDSWVVMAVDCYDAQGNLWRTHLTPLINAYQVPVTMQLFSYHYDFRLGHYGVNACQVGVPYWRRYPEPEPDSFFSPDSLRKRGLR